MKTVVLLYETCCVYEIVVTNYFLQFSGHEIVFATVDGNSVTAQERFSLNATCALNEIDPKEVELLLVPGGNISSIANEKVYSFIRAVIDNKQLVAGICNGVDELENAGILEGIESTHSVKAKSPEKIDGIVAAIMALDRCIRHENPSSVYDESGLMVV